MVYIFILISTCLFSILKSNIKHKKTIDIIILLYMTIFYGIRYEVGKDYLSYERHFYNTTGFYGKLEPLYDMSMKVFRYFNSPFWIYTLFIGFTIYYILYLIAKDLNLDYSKVIIYYIITGIMFVSFNLVRQTLAGVIVLFALRYINIKNFKKYLITIIIASLIHYSAIVFIPLYFVERLNITKKAWGYLLTIGMILYFSSFTNKILIYITPSKYKHFIGGRFGYRISPGMGVLFYIIIAIIIGFKSIYIKKEIRQYYHIYMLGYTILLFTLNIFIMSRLNLYFQMALSYILPDMLQNSRPKTSIFRIGCVCITIGFLLIFTKNIFNIYHYDTNKLLYRTIFN